MVTNHLSGKSSSLRVNFGSIPAEIVINNWITRNKSVISTLYSNIRYKFSNNIFEEIQ